MEIEIPIPYNFIPRSYQKGPFIAFERGTKRFLTTWHRRAGKDKTWLNFMVMRMLERVGAYYYILPTYRQGRQIIWDGIDADGFKFINHIPPEMVKSKNEAESKIELYNGSIFQLLGSDNIDRIVGVNPVGVVFSEYSLQDPRAWDFYRPILNENGGWAAFNFTPRGRNHAYSLYQSIKDLPNWFTSVLTVNDTRRDAPEESGEPVVTREMIEQDLNEGMDPELVQQEYYCSFSGVMTGSYYGKVLEKAHNENRITDVPWLPHLPVATAWDLGVADAMVVIFFQVVGPWVHVIDHIERRGEGLAYFASELKGKPYTYSNHYAPHDIKARELGSGKTRLEVAQSLGINFRVVKNIPIQDGIDAVRTMFPRVRIDQTKGARLVTCLTNYHRSFDDKKREFNPQPVHDWSSHSADAMRYLAICHEEEFEDRAQQVTATGMNDSVYDDGSAEIVY